MKYLLPLVVTFLSTWMLAQVQTYSNIDDSLTNWGECYESQNPPCNPGGTVPPITVVQKIVNSPCLDGKCMELSTTGQSGSNDYTDVLWYYKPGVFEAAAYFKHSYSILLSSLSNAQAFEFDLFKFDSSTGVEYMFGSQCVVGGYWQVWNYRLSNPWVNTSVPCKLTASKWHTIVIYDHLVAGDNSCSGRPCMFYDNLVVDGTNYPLNLQEPAQSLPQGWNSTVGVQFQLDINTKGGTLTEHVDKDVFTVCSESFASSCQI